MKKKYKVVTLASIIDELPEVKELGMIRNSYTLEVSLNNFSQWGAKKGLDFQSFYTDHENKMTYLYFIDNN